MLIDVFFSNFRNEILAFETQYNKEWLSVITRQPLVCTVFNKLRYMIFPIEREKCERWNLSFEWHRMLESVHLEFADVRPTTQLVNLHGRASRALGVFESWSWREALWGRGQITEEKPKAWYCVLPKYTVVYTRSFQRYSYNFWPWHYGTCISHFPFCIFSRLTPLHMGCT